ncbi:unnamed protein product [Nippostrongylus brasiliensis]|uniref:ZP domain-containing protein n=1 Tax=Nippostrongylus brasiliensis TaxID=27835 RepID=A0A0N4YAJ3_NIPBR|nr:unnamed protein product [Nippostrongylus brasiliensis]
MHSGLWNANLPLYIPYRFGWITLSSCENNRSFGRHTASISNSFVEGEVYFRNRTNQQYTVAVEGASGPISFINYSCDSLALKPERKHSNKIIR